MLAKIISTTFTVYSIMLIVRILGSWVPELSEKRFMQFIAFYTDPYLNFFRKFIPPLGMIDISPIVAFIALRVLESMIFRILF